MITDLNINLAIFLFWLLIISGCKNGLSDSYSVDPYIESLQKDLDEVSVVWNIHPASDVVYNANYFLTSKNCNKLIVVDRADLSIILADINGDVLHKTGGKGRGPGEFQSILSLHIGHDNRLYTIDGISKRVSVYEIDDDELNYISSVSYKEPPQYFLNSVYVTQYGNFGVYQESEGFFSAENKFLLYSLDENYSPIEQLLEMPGNEMFESDRGDYSLYTPHKYLGKTIWGFDDSWFYYITTMNSKVYMYNVESTEKQEFNPLHVEERFNTDEFTRLVKNKHDPDNEDTEYWMVMDDIETLPLLSQMISEDGKIILQVMTPPGIEGATIYFDRESEQLKLFRTPQEFNPTALCGEVIYGINFQIEGDYELVSVRFVGD